MTKAEWERARQLGEEARRAGRDRAQANPWAMSFTGDGVSLAMAFDTGWDKEDQERRK